MKKSKQGTARAEKHGRMEMDDFFTKKEPIWKEHWKNMPEFIQEDKQAVQKIIVNFEKYEDVERFAKLVGYKLTKKTKSIWYPYREKDKPREWVYTDEK